MMFHDGLSYEPAGSIVVTWSVLPTTIGLPEPASPPSPSSPPPPAASASVAALTTATARTMRTLPRLIYVHLVVWAARVGPGVWGRSCGVGCVHRKFRPASTLA